jgi:hypothetical protein
MCAAEVLEHVGHRRADVAAGVQDQTSIHVPVPPVPVIRSDRG